MPSQVSCCEEPDQRFTGWHGRGLCPARWAAGTHLCASRSRSPSSSISPKSATLWAPAATAPPRTAQPRVVSAGQRLGVRVRGEWNLCQKESPPPPRAETCIDSCVWPSVMMAVPSKQVLPMASITPPLLLRSSLRTLTQPWILQQRESHWPLASSTGAACQAYLGTPQGASMPSWC